MAEIHGKHNQAIESDEDYLTSSVFGHLRHVKESVFWTNLFRKALAADGSPTNLMSQLEKVGAALANPCDLKMLFWPKVPREESKATYDEPDLVLYFRNPTQRPIVIVVEVKLNAEKSSTGCDDQLCRYFRLLQNRSALNTLFGIDIGRPAIGLVYLTQRFSSSEVLDSIKSSLHADAGRTMFPLQWQDVTEVVQEMHPESGTPLDEVLRFLQHRGYEHFRGFRELPASTSYAAGPFYEGRYFSGLAFIAASETPIGGFYAR